MGSRAAATQTTLTLDVVTTGRGLACYITTPVPITQIFKKKNEGKDLPFTAMVHLSKEKDLQVYSSKLEK